MLENQIVLLIIIVGGFYLLVDEFYGKHKLDQFSLMIVKNAGGGK